MLRHPFFNDFAFARLHEEEEELQSQPQLLRYAMEFATIAEKCEEMKSRLESFVRVLQGLCPIDPKGEFYLTECVQPGFKLRVRPAARDTRFLNCFRWFSLVFLVLCWFLLGFQGLMFLRDVFRTVA